MGLTAGAIGGMNFGVDWGRGAKVLLFCALGRDGEDRKDPLHFAISDAIARENDTGSDKRGRFGLGV